MNVLYSRLGYEKGLSARIVFRDHRRQESPSVTLTSSTDKAVLFQLDSVYWGERWGSHWWIADVPAEAFSEHSIRIQGQASHSLFGLQPAGSDLLWQQTFEPVALVQAQRRQRFCRTKPGWRDCGSFLQEANSHCVYLWGMLDILENCGWRFEGDVGRSQRQRLLAQIDNGLACLCGYQDLAREKGLGDGALIHEPNAQPDTVIRNDVVKAALVFARSARLLEGGTSKYLDRARQAFEWASTASAFKPDTFEPRAHGAPADYRPKLTDCNASDLLHMAWAAFELSYLDPEYEPIFHDWLERALQRQVREDEAEDGLHGHFFCFDDRAFTENAWTHHGVSFDGGQTFAHVLFPLFRALQRWPEHPDSPRWKTALERFAYGFLLPACERNPFLICPLGVFGTEGLLEYAGLWHGMNAVYGFTAALALDFFERFGDKRFKAVAAGNLYWITGLNAGLTQEAVDLGSHMFHDVIPDGRAEPRSMIYQCPNGAHAGSWTTIPGSITNGFSVGNQFRHDVEPTRANDGPFAFNDEEWITHAGGWLAALSRLEKI